MPSKEKLNRRSFIGRSVASVVGAGLGLSGAAKALSAVGSAAVEGAGSKEKPRIREYRELGGTGWKVSEIAFGNGGMQEPSTLEYAIERGINYVDTARQYYDMEKVIGQIFPAKRDKLFVTTKLMPELITPETTAEQVMTGIEESLERLNTDYVDCCLIHSVGEDPKLSSPDKIKNTKVHEAFAKAKEQGKIRFWGASSHGPRMIEDFDWLVENTDIDMIMPGMNLMTKGIEPVIAKARKEDVAVVAMKSLSAARKIVQSQYMKDAKLVRRVVLKWLLAQPNIDTISITAPTFEAVDEYVSISGKKQMSPEEKEILIGYSTTLEHDYCRPGCDCCLDSCPHNVPIYDILRYRLYFENYGREKYAMSLYSSLPESRKASVCGPCHAPCESNCPYNIAIRTKLLETHSELTV
ncbi:MAG: aldo/keto reductase [Candidatus Krumholzibacteria bacterium]|nr:aldo/keto reductase [Candidatus Krumholzibacteria bacterium]